MKIIEAIQEAYGPEYTTLEDAINWWSGPMAWREDFTAVLILKSGKRPCENISIKCERGFKPFSHYFFTESEVQ